MANEDPETVAEVAVEKRSIEDHCSGEASNIKRSFVNYIITNGKNPISVLNELFNGLHYNVIECLGSPHNPLFKVLVEVDGQNYCGVGNSKRAAKCDAAAQALHSFNVGKGTNMKRNQLDFSCGQIKDNSLIADDSSQEITIKKRHFKPSIIESQNPIAVLNEWRNGLKYDVVECSGPPHNPKFTVSVEIEDQTYFGVGNSKKSAKYDAARQAIHFFTGPKNDCGGISVNSAKSEKTDFICNNSKIHQDNTFLEITHIKRKLECTYNGQNPIAVLNEWRNGLKYKLVEYLGPPHNPKFTVSVEIDDQIYCGVGYSKKAAKCDAAFRALHSLNFDQLSNNRIISVNKSDKSEKTNFTSGQILDNRLQEDESTQETVNKKRKVVKTINLEEKNPISVLNELRSGLKYDVIEHTGPSHNPTFKVSVEVDGQIYFGVGNSKKAAKCDAATQALQSFIQFPNNGTIISVSRTVKNEKMDFTSDRIIDKDKALKLGKSKLAKGPLMILNELYPNAQFTCVNNESDPYARFKFTITIRNEIFCGTGSNKKLAKNAAALAALSKLINYQMSAEQQNLLPVEYKATSSEDQEKADTIGRLVNEKFATLMADDLTHIKRKVLAGIVMSKGATMENAEVICVTTGTKCVSGEHISINGASLNDMHAEILTRRCLINYFYDQLELLLQPDSSKSIFEENKEGKGFKLKEGIEFHLYINTAPCGDARIFSPHENNPNEDRHPNRISRGQLRTKIESGEGTIPVRSAASFQTWDGIIQGERLLTMSCSDKICRWNVLGLQGGLLSHFIEPIYLKTIILGSLMKEPHLYRAICGRIENTLQGLPPPFLLNRPTMLKLTSTETRQPQKAPNFAVIWSIGLQKPEIINTTMGKPEEGMSVVSKQNLAKRFATIYDQLTRITKCTEKPVTYKDAKEQATNYNVAKNSLNEAFTKSELGSWISKPIEQDMFDLFN